MAMSHWSCRSRRMGLFCSPPCLLSSQDLAALNIGTLILEHWEGFVFQTVGFILRILIGANRCLCVCSLKVSVHVCFWNAVCILTTKFFAIPPQVDAPPNDEFINSFEGKNTRVLLKDCPCNVIKARWLSKTKEYVLGVIVWSCELVLFAGRCWKGEGKSAQLLKFRGSNSVKSPWKRAALSVSVRFVRLLGRRSTVVVVFVGHDNGLDASILNIVRYAVTF